MDTLDFTSLDLLPGIALVLDLGGRVVHSNRACAELLGHPSAGLRGQPIAALLADPQDAVCVQAIIEALEAGEPAKTFECGWMRPGGERRIFAISGAIAPGPDAGEALLVLTGVDVTQIVCRREEDIVRLRALLEQAPDGIFIADLNGRFTDVNDAGCQMLGYAKHEIVGKPIIDVILPEDVERMLRSRTQMLGGAVEVGTWLLCKKDGSHLPVEVSTKLLPDGRWQGLVRDITARLQMESAMQDSIIARRAIAARDEVLGIVAHDLRNPLNIVLLHSEILRRRGAEAPKSLVAIRRAALRMSRLIGDMLDVTALEAGSLAVERDEVPVRSLLDEAIDTESDAAARAQLQLRIEAPEQTPALLADRDRLLQVFDNLIGNAIKFTPAGGEVVVGAQHQDQMVQFSVSDTGAGIPPDELAHVFDRFWQAKKTDSRGAGLGLPIVKGIVEAHGGMIWVQSEPGCGTTFYFTVPTKL
ncbi:Sensory box histidine kinase [Enhygromyxa salina]|uniref:histidine kinase n=1 Tax=Enhygromyxa salina TaxID=215803 RepID=A0A0C2CXM0_9BACT|nr:PAS domain S-box protein [Enhygromyxa salina]KIG14390.1 Sensory box histidine kinase [Enhygromyxa salina]